jgi:HK97 family phage prohead protease
MPLRKDYAPGDRIECDMHFVASSLADAPEGYIVGTASTPSIDLHGHKVIAGAFDESIRTRGLHGPKRVKLLAFHDMDKVAGTIKRLETVQDRLRIETQLNLNVSYVKDVYEVSKMDGGLSFSVGFRMVKDGYRFLDEEEEKKEGYWLEITKGDLLEVSVVAFPAQPDATMDFVKDIKIDDIAAFEKKLRDEGIAKSRNEAHSIWQVCKNNPHLFGQPLLVPPKPAHPLPDALQLQAAMDLTARMRSLLGSR